MTGLVNQELLLRIEYLAAENRILRAHLPSRPRLSDAERSTLAEIAKRPGRKAHQEIARVAKRHSSLNRSNPVTLADIEISPFSGFAWASTAVCR